MISHLSKTFLFVTPLTLSCSRFRLLVVQAEKKKILVTCGLLYLFSQIFFLINIQFPRGLNFDEFHYVPSAKQFLELKENQNWEHPPLGKMIMAAGIGLLGDRPIGWRLMSTVFGALTLVGMYLWALSIFRDEQTALWVALLSLVNQLLYVQSRIGMLDTFMMTFITLGMAAFFMTWLPRFPLHRSRKLILLSGVCFGLGSACKWFALIPWAGCVGIVLVIRVLQLWKTRFEKPRDDDWYHPELWAGLKWSDWILAMGIIPVVVYFITFLPFFFIEGSKIGLWDLILMQKKMFEGQLRVVSSHPYMSHWSDWPLLHRPIWYAFDKEGPNNEWVRGVLLIGNPLLMWSGIPALGLCLWGWITTRDRNAFLILFSYFVMFGSWALIPRKIAFYYYYYPAGMTLSFALAYVFQNLEKHSKSDVRWGRWAFLGAAIGVFIYFFPILAAFRIASGAFQKWMLFQSWI